MKTAIKIFTLLLLALGLAACQEKMPEGADLKTLRVALTPAPEVFSNLGGVAACAAIVHEGALLNQEWTVSVDNNPDWITVEKIDYDSSFTGTYEGDDKVVTVPGVRISVEPNTSSVKRTAYLRFSVADGGSITYLINQSR